MLSFLSKSYIKILLSVLLLNLFLVAFLCNINGNKIIFIDFKKIEKTVQFIPLDKTKTLPIYIAKHIAALVNKSKLVRTATNLEVHPSQLGKTPVIEFYMKDGRIIEIVQAFIIRKQNKYSMFFYEAIQSKDAYIFIIKKRDKCSCFFASSKEIPIYLKNLK